MAKRISFDIPDDAYDGIIACLTTDYATLVRNPAYDGSDPTIPMQIVNTASREEAARQHIINYVGQKFETWASQAQLAPAQAKIQAAVAARKTAVLSATVSSVEKVE